jgi:RNA polymerase sigma factor (sigma-70 family)
MRTEDGKIIKRCLDGEPEAFGLLVDKYKASIFALVFTKIRNYHDAQDVTQEVFLKAYRDLKSLKRWDSFLWWLYSIAHNACKEWIRKQSSRPDFTFADQDEMERIMENSSMDAYNDNRMIEFLHEALDSLPNTYREVLTLYYLGGMNSAEIAIALNTTPAAIRQQLSRARTQLKEEVLAMMSDTFQQHKLQASFTFKIVEAVKRIKINTVPTLKGLPWGLSLATGIIITIMSFNPNLISFNHIGTPIFSSLQAESKVLKVGEIPVDVVKSSNISFISNQMGKGKGGEPKQPDMQNALLMAPQVEGDKWVKKADMPTARWCYTAEIKGKIYAIGGTTDDVNALSVVEEYNPKTDTWIKKADMPTARDFLSVNTVNGKIYAIGGSTKQGNILLSTVEEYDPSLDKWVKKSDMPTPRCSSATSVVDGKIYAIGGWGPGDISTVEEYDPVLDKWTKKANMPTARQPRACAVNGKIYAIGGFKNGGTTFVEEYDPKLDIWTKKTDMPTARGSFGIAAVNGKIYTIGGTLDLNQVYSIVEEYDPVSDTWTKKTDMQIARAYVSASVADGKIYVIGGAKLPAAMTATVEEYTPEGWQPQSVSPQGKMPKTWGKIKVK